jgi:hypothetical protein
MDPLANRGGASASKPASGQPGKRRAGPGNSRAAVPVRTVVEKAKEGAKAKGREPQSPPEKQERAKAVVRERVDGIKERRRGALGGEQGQERREGSGSERGRERRETRGEGRDDFKARMLERREARRRERGEEPAPRDS